MIKFYCSRCKSEVRRGRGQNLIPQVRLHIKQKHFSDAVALFENMYIEQKKGIPLGY
jgi:hypothetical protein